MKLRSYMDLVPPQGIRLTPKHYAYVKISEGCNHRCTFCIIPSLRGDLVSRPVGDVMQEAQSLVNSGVKELLVISQDTSAYGVDIVSHRLLEWPPAQEPHDRAGCCAGGARRLGAFALCVPVPACGRGDTADGAR